MVSRQPTCQQATARRGATAALLLAILSGLAVGATGCKGCQKEPPPPAETESTLRPPEAAEPPAAATATEAPAAATAVDAPAEATPVHYSIAPAFPSGFPLVAGKLAKMTLTPTGDSLALESEFEPVLGQDFLVFIGRPGHDWSAVVGVPTGTNKSSTFPIAFTPPSAGNYSVVCVFKPKGKPLAIEQLTISATGDSKVAPMPLSDDLNYTEDNGLHVALRLEPESVVARKQIQLGTLWTRNQAPLALTPAAAPPGSEPNAAPTVLYFVVDVAEPRIETPFALADAQVAAGTAPAGKADGGSRASLTFQRPGQYLVAAVAAPTADNGKLVTATFALNVGDSAAPAASDAPAAETP